MASDIERRKADHLDLCATDDVAFRERTTLLECVRFEHQALPELSLDEIDPSVALFGKRLRYPIVIAGMTGGHERAAEVNRGLARVAEQRGYAFGLGSQRAMLEKPELAATYSVRDVAPTALVFGNIGMVKARETSTAAIAELVRAVGADALCVHLNPAMEIVQDRGDRDFRGGVETLARLVDELPVHVIAKETGSGIGSGAAKRLVEAGVRFVDTSGAGGTSWVGVEALRAEGAARRLGEALWDWGIPTAASIARCRREGLTVIATGGIRDGVDIARAIALGASAGGIARRAYQAFLSGGEAGAHEYFDDVEAQLRAILLLTGSPTIAALKRTSVTITGELREWLSAP